MGAEITTSTENLPTDDQLLHRKWSTNLLNLDSDFFLGTIVVSASFSLIGGVFVILSFIFFKKIQTVSFGYIGLMTICETLLASILVLNSPDNHSWLCTMQGFYS